MFPEHINFQLETCVKERGRRAAGCMGSVPVADLLASEARHARARGHAGHARSAYNDPSLCLFPGDRSRESCGTWQLPQIIALYCPIIIRPDIEMRELNFLTRILSMMLGARVILQGRILPSAHRNIFKSAKILPLSRLFYFESRFTLKDIVIKTFKTFSKN